MKQVTGRCHPKCTSRSQYGTGICRNRYCQRHLCGGRARQWPEWQSTDLQQQCQGDCRSDPLAARPCRGRAGVYLPGSHRIVWAGCGRAVAHPGHAGERGQPSGDQTLCSIQSDAQSNRPGRCWDDRRILRKQKTPSVGAAHPSSEGAARPVAPPGRPAEDAPDGTQPSRGE